ncbi:hypothetical protein HY993_04315, partial [Candidatus Micrarchaeota archaeon]|nr:hypothetical protein [Candidatus Micrarchaeota archaeon]
MKEEEKSFSELGLSNNEGRILSFLLENGKATGSSVATKIGVNKSVAYFVLDQLVQKKLASFIVVNKKREYQPIEPELLKIRIEERKKEFAKNLDWLQALILAKPKASKQPNFSVFDGWNGMKLAMEDVLAQKTGVEYFVFAVDVPDNILSRFRRAIKQFHLKRSKKGINCRLLVSERLKNTVGADRKKEPNTQVRFVSSENAMPLTVNV